MTATERLNEWCDAFGLTFFNYVQPGIRRDGVLELVGIHERYPIPEDCDLRTARRIQRLIVERQRAIRAKPARRPGE